MIYNTVLYSENVSNVRFKVFIFAFLCQLLLFAPFSCRKRSGQQVRPSPPDLSRCTRIEIQYFPSTLERYTTLEQEALLIPSEKQYLESLKTIVVDDPGLIKELAYDLSLGRYNGTETFFSQQHIADVVCYHNSERLTSFMDYFSYILDQDGHWFHYNKRSISVIKLTPQARPFYLRVSCARHLWDCQTSLRLFFDNEGKKYSPSKWCDAIVRVYRAANISKKEIMGSFKCPGAGEGKCHYALNPHCEPNSPLDIVHLFETKAGWNQHGGPELFTFDNHEPKGGCVLLNDGTVKFIRTKEELNKLRWK